MSSTATYEVHIHLRSPVSEDALVTVTVEVEDGESEDDAAATAALKAVRAVKASIEVESVRRLGEPAKETVR